MNTSKIRLGKVKRLIMLCSAALAVATLSGCLTKTDKTVDNTAAENTKQIVSLEKQKINLEGVANARQLGGYIGADGRKIKENVLLRTAELTGISDNAIAELSEKYNVKNIIDFRMDYERKAKPDIEIQGAKNTWISVFELDLQNKDVQNMLKNMQAVKDDEVGLMLEYVKLPNSEKLYEDILMSEKGQNGFAQFFDILAAQENGAALWHCSQGKDRAGIASALVLYALGVDEETILADFELSNEAYKQQIEYIGEESKKRGYDDKTTESAKAFAGVSSERFNDAFDMVKAEYGSIDDYLKNQLEVSEDELHKLRENYLEKK